MSKPKRNLKNKRSMMYAGLEALEHRVLMSTYTVNTLSDSAAPGAGQLTLRQAIADANSNPGTDTVAFSSSVFASGSTHTITLTQGQLNVTGNTNIQGPGQSVLVIDANHASRAMQVSSGTTVSISALTMTNGSITAAAGVSAFGGAVANYGSLTLTNVAVSNSVSQGGAFPASDEEYDVTAGSAGGGGIYTTGPLSLINSVVTGNTARAGSSFYGSDGSSFGGGIYASGSLTVSGSIISSNLAAAGDADSELHGNGGQSQGGGVFASSTMSISTTTIANNTAAGGNGQALNASDNPGGPGFGGGVFAEASSSFSGDAITSNKATGGNAGGGVGNGSPAAGGAIYSAAPVVMTSTHLSGNIAKGGYSAFDDGGSGGNASGGAIAGFSSLNISGSTFTSNSALGGGGDSEGGNQNFPGTPDSSGFGGAIYASASLILATSTLSGNVAQGDFEGGGARSYGGSGGLGEGGGLFLDASAVITSSTLSGNSATGGAGHQPYSGGEVGGNGGDGDGGGIYNNGVLTLTNSTLTANTADGGAAGDSYFNGGSFDGGGGVGGNGNGSAIFSINTIQLNDSTISGNTTSGGAAGTSGSGYPAGAAGSAITTPVDQGNDTMNNSIVSGNFTSTSIENDLEDADFTYASSGYNLVGTSNGQILNGEYGNIVGDPGLAPLADNGGPTQTMLPLFGSAAVNAGRNSLVPSGLTTDQRGYARIAGGTVDIGAVEVQSASVSGTVFNDLNGDGVRQSGEGGLAGVTVYADLANAGLYQSGDPTAVTNSSGNFTLSGVPEGTVIVRQQLPSAYRQSFPIGGDGDHVTLTPAGVTGALFADSTRLYVSGSVTFNGAGEGGVVVYADLNNDGKFESNENNKTTGSDGSFAFVSLTPGTYTFRVLPPAGQVISGNSAITVTLGSGGMDQDVNFSLVPVTTSTKLTGTIIGTAGSYQNDGNIIAKAFDGILTNYFDGPTANGDYAGLNLGSAKVITSIAYDPRTGFASRMVGGIFQGSNNPNFTGAVTLYTITTAPPGDTLTTVSISNSTPFQYVRYLAPNGSWGDVGELAFYGTTATHTQLTGTVIGTTGSYQSQGNTIAKVFDGNLSTFFDAPTGTGSWVGLDLGSAQVVTQAEYAPRSGWASRMVGGEIQASNTADFSSGVVTLYTINSAPTAGSLTTVSLNNTTAYRYYRYIGPASSFCNIAELELFS